MTDIEEIKSRLNIIDIVSEKVRLKRSGSNYFGLCPFHSEKSPSFNVNETMQRFKCFGCGESGDIFTFTMKIENLEFREALEALAEKAGIKLTKNIKNPNEAKFKEELEKLYKINELVTNFYQKNLFDGDNEGLKYARKRNLTDDLIRKFGIGYATDSSQELINFLAQKDLNISKIEEYGLAANHEGKIHDKFRNRLMFSVYNDHGRVVGFSGRFFGQAKPGFEPPKYLNSPETIAFKKNQLLFGLYQAVNAIRKLNFVIVSEGQMNIIASHRVGVENIVASLGTSFTEQHLKLLSRYTTNIYFAFDRDNAGKKALLRTMELVFAQDLNSKVISWDAKIGKDPDELITFNEKLWFEAVNSALDPIEHMFAEFEANYSLDDLDRVTNFLKAILHLISFHKNEVKKEFYLKYLSSKFGLTITALREMLQKNNSQQIVLPTKKINDDKVIKKPEIDVFSRIFALILQNWSSVKHLILAIERDYLSDKYVDLYDCLSLFTDVDDVKEVYENTEGEVRELFDNLILLTVMIDERVSAEQHVMKLIPVAKNEFKKFLVLEWRKNPDDKELFDRINRVVRKGD